jgi:hypothetical protein
MSRMGGTAPWVVALFALLLVASACAGGSDEGAAKAHAAGSRAEAAHSDKARPLPDLGVPPTPTTLTPGRYATGEFEPPVSFRVGKGWAMNNPEKKDHFSIYSRAFASSDKESGAVLTFVDVRTIFDAKEPTEDNIHPAPKDLLAWFRRHPRLDTSKPVPTTVGGLPAERFDASVSSLPKETHDECPECLPVFGLRFGEPISVVKGFRQRIFLMEAPTGETVAIVFYAPPDRFYRYLPKARGVLNTVGWRARKG